jgi:hypothetical protein
MIVGGYANIMMSSALNLEYQNGTSPKYWYRYSLDVSTVLYEYPQTQNFIYIRGNQLSF